MSQWRKVLDVRDAPGSFYRLTLDCGHERTLDAIRKSPETRDALLASTVPCPSCPEPDRRAG